MERSTAPEGLIDTGVNVHEPPGGNPAQEYVTACEGCERSAAVTVVWMVSPTATVPKDGLAEREKSNASSG